MRKENIYITPETELLSMYMEQETIIMGSPGTAGDDEPIDDQGDF